MTTVWHRNRGRRTKPAIQTAVIVLRARCLLASHCCRRLLRHSVHNANLQLTLTSRTRWHDEHFRDGMRNGPLLRRIKTSSKFLRNREGDDRNHIFVTLPEHCKSRPLPRPWTLAICNFSDLLNCLRPTTDPGNLANNHSTSLSHLRDTPVEARATLPAWEETNPAFASELRYDLTDPRTPAN